MPAEQVEALIVGAGPAGLSTGIGLKRLGVRKVVVTERESEAGGLPRLCHHTGFGRSDLVRLYSGPGYARYYRDAAAKAGVEIRTSTTITGWKDNSTLTFTSPDGLGEIHAQAILLATGVRERPRAARLVPGSRPQGVFTTGSLQRFVYQEHLPVGRRAVIVGAELVSLSALLTLLHARVEIAMLITDLPRHQIYMPYLPMKWALADFISHTPIITQARITNIGGGKRVEAVEITHLDSGRVETIPCDTVVFTGDWVPEHELARLGGLEIDPGTRGPQVDAEFRSSLRGVFAAGNLLRGVATADQCALEGRRAAQSMAQYLRDGQWSKQRLAVQVEPPLAWVCPNSIPPVQSKQPAPFQFRSHEFKNKTHLQVRQGQTILSRRTFHRLIVNEIMHFDGDWVSKVDLGGPPVRITLAS
jgi:NADPH-dependent 2,4-dienoyl-CoA reductase/sulfur reductase-like enzyme